MNIFDYGPPRKDLPSISEITDAFTEQEWLRQAIEYCVVVTGRWCVGGQINVRSIDPIYRKVDELMPRTFRLVGIGGLPEFDGFQLKEEDAQEAWELFRESVVASEEFKERLSIWMNLTDRIPPAARLMVSAILAGELKGPSGFGNRQPELQRDTLLRGMALRLTTFQIYNLGAGKPKLAHNQPVPICGATIAAAALSAYGLQLRPQRADEIVRNKALPIETADEFGTFDFGRRAGTKNALAILFMSRIPSGYLSEIELARAYLAGRC
jgi:hypothetical protein